jgi:phosphoribosylglycinamide formyltransferase 2
MWQKRPLFLARGNTVTELSAASWGAPLSAQAQKLLLLGAGELGKEVAIEAMRLGLEVIAVDSYEAAPAMQVAHRSHVIDMLDGAQLRAVIEQAAPRWIVPEVEAIATDTLLALEAEGWQVVPTARATRLTMNREGIRRLTAEELGLRTSPYRFAATEAEYTAAIAAIGLPCVVKPIMSSSGKGQSLVRQPSQVMPAWDHARTAGRGKSDRVIVEGFVNFDVEITLLTGCRWHLLLPADWAPAGGGRLPRIVAALPPEPGHPSRMPAPGGGSHIGPRWLRPVWR